MKKLAACLVALATVACWAPAHAQQTEQGLRLFENTPSPDPIRQLRRLAEPANDLVAAVALEGAVDPDAYIVGPGDVFTVTVGTAVPQAFPLTVTPDGSLAFPEAGSIAVAGRTLTETRAMAQQALRSVYRNVRADVSLTQPRRFYVHVAGAVGAPGRYPASPVTRVSDVLGLAYTDSTHAVANPGWRPSLRSVTLTRGDARQVLDVQRYLATGATAHNPYLRDGDVLTVGAYDRGYGVVYIDGAVPFPGAYPYRSDDTAADLLALATGGAGTDAAVHLTRYAPDGPAETVEVGDAAGVALRPLDHLYVAPPRTDIGSVTLEGAVRFPGTYPVHEGVTTLADLLARAGGLRSDALPRGAYLERAPLDAASSTLRALSEASLRADTAAALFGRTRLADLSFPSRAYLARELRLGRRAAINLDDGGALFLQDGDRVVIPRDAGTVRVFGQVARPGDVAFEPGWDVDAYLAAAGGRTSLATRVYVVEAGTNRYLPAEDVTLRSGDALFVDRRADIADTIELQRVVLEEQRARGERRARILQTVTATTGLISAIATLYIATRR